MRALAAVCLLLLVLPSAAALPAPSTGLEIIASHYAYDPATGSSCSSYDPAVGLLSLDVTSSLGHVEAGGSTTYSLQLGPVPGSACPTIDLDFTTSLPWSTERNTFVSSSFTSSCGASGYVFRGISSNTIGFGLFFQSLPAACALPITATTILGFSIEPIAPSAGLVCMPVVVPRCSGVNEQAHPVGACERETISVEAMGIVLLYGEHACDWATGEEHGTVGDGLGVIAIRGEPGSCEVSLLRVVGAEQRAACPAEIRDAIYGVDWLAILP